MTSSGSCVALNYNEVTSLCSCLLQSQWTHLYSRRRVWICEGEKCWTPCGCSVSTICTLNVSIIWTAGRYQMSLNSRREKNPWRRKTQLIFSHMTEQEFTLLDRDRKRRVQKSGFCLIYMFFKQEVKSAAFFKPLKRLSCHKTHPVPDRSVFQPVHGHEPTKVSLCLNSCRGSG